MAKQTIFLSWLVASPAPKKSSAWGLPSSFLCFRHTSDPASARKRLTTATGTASRPVKPVGSRPQSRSRRSARRAVSLRCSHTYATISLAPPRHFSEDGQIDPCGHGQRGLTIIGVCVMNERHFGRRYRETGLPMEALCSLTMQASVELAQNFSVFGE